MAERPTCESLEERSECPEPEGSSPEVNPKTELPPAKDLAKLQLAAADMVEFGMPLEESASLHAVDPDTLHVFYRTFASSVGKENLPVAQNAANGDTAAGFDRSSSRQFDRNWAQRAYVADRDRVLPSKIRCKLIAFPLTGWMFSGNFIDKMALAGVVCAILLGFLVVKITGRDRDPVDQTQQPNREPQRSPITRLSTYLDEFVGLETWDQRLPFVRNSESVAPPSIRTSPSSVVAGKASPSSARGRTGHLCHLRIWSS